VGFSLPAIALQRLGHLLGEFHAERSLYLFHPVISRQPSTHCSLLTAIDEIIVPPKIVILRVSEPDLSNWRRQL
jgi:uncharacterized protein